MIASWKDRVNGKFILLKHLKKHSVFMSDDAYGVLGIFTPLATMFPDVPMFVEAVLVPFRGVPLSPRLGFTHRCRRERKPSHYIVLIQASFSGVSRTPRFS